MMLLMMDDDDAAKGETARNDVQSPPGAQQLLQDFIGARSRTLMRNMSDSFESNAALHTGAPSAAFGAAA